MLKIIPIHSSDKDNGRSVTPQPEFTPEPESKNIAKKRSVNKPKRKRITNNAYLILETPQTDIRKIQINILNFTKEDTGKIRYEIQKILDDIQDIKPTEQNIYLKVSEDNLELVINKVKRFMETLFPST